LRARDKARDKVTAMGKEISATHDFDQIEAAMR
jgi:hypothetical protein